MSLFSSYAGRILQERFTASIDSTEWDEGLIRTDGPGHTRAVSKLERTHAGRPTAAYYAAAILCGELNEAFGSDILQALRSLQIADETSTYNGAFLWYREETQVSDSNAAFFTLMPLVCLALCKPEAIPAGHRKQLEEMMRLALRWFARETEHPSLYYPNKIVSDGALYMAMAHLLEENGHYEKAVRFFERWSAYTTDRGWGWGENISPGYIRIVVTGLRLACLTLREEHAGLRERLQAHMDTLLSYNAFHGDHEFVPAIRSYNFEGHTRQSSLMLRLAGVIDSDSALLYRKEGLWNWINFYLLFERELELPPQQAAQPVPRERKEHVFDGSYATSWIGHHGRLGSLNRFPVIPGSYQWPTWGLAWQTFPVSFSVNEEQISYLRWLIREGDYVRSHPAKSYGDNYLSPALFRESYYPDIQLRSAQHENALVVVRSMSGIHHVFAEAADEWMVKRFTGTVTSYESGAGVSWIVLHFAAADVAIAALNGISSDMRRRGTIKPEVEREEDQLRIRQVLYRGEETVHHFARLETGWAVVHFDRRLAGDELHRRLDRLSITDRSFQDGEVPRAAHDELREIRLFDGTDCLTELRIDPYTL
ncbi:hypothetical protein [Paenibacillus ginsengarvi]|uniref:hypothetical protein n=1 Tax=Paenibacillus ginsengarvi TaxID=400777 RepID=UPI0013155315|nr:hypothetical protein [Paenibacillus ginsengarvi]